MNYCIVTCMCPHAYTSTVCMYLHMYSGEGDCDIDQALAARKVKTPLEPHVAPDLTLFGGVATFSMYCTLSIPRGFYACSNTYVCICSTLCSNM